VPRLTRQGGGVKRQTQTRAGGVEGGMVVNGKGMKGVWEGEDKGEEKGGRERKEWELTRLFC